MTGLLDTRMRAAAERLISRFGKAMTLTREVVGTYVASTGTSPVTATSYPVVGVFGSPSKAMLDMGEAVAGDMSVLLAAKAMSVEPQPGDKLVVDSVTWQIMATRSIWSGELVALYELLARS